LPHSLLRTICIIRDGEGFVNRLLQKYFMLHPGNMGCSIWLSQSKQFFCGAMEDLFAFFGGEGEFIEALHFLIWGPHGVVGRVHDAVSAEEADYFNCALGRYGKE